MLPVVSVITTTRNEEKNIESCLKSVTLQTYPKEKIEIIVIDNNSSDNTKEIAKRFTRNVLNKGPERSAQRNLGMKVSRGTYCLYLDADMLLHKEVLRESVSIMERDPNVVGLYIPEVVIVKTFLSQIRRFERSFYNATVIDCVRFVRRNIADEVGGFAEDLTGPEDWDFDKKIRMKGKVALISSPVFHNEKDVTLRSYLQKKAYYAKSFKRYIHKWGSTDSDIRRQFGFWYRYAGVFLENCKWIKVVLHPILTASMLYLKLLVGIQYLKNKHLS